jgi:vitamin B12 transporter
MKVMLRDIFLFFVLLVSWLSAQTAVGLPEMVVDSPRIANQAPVGTFAMPVSALRFEPLVDVQGRNLAEGQSDIIIRGGTFENSGFRIGLLTILDPQTGHYLAEIPVPPAMLGAPDILTGVSNALASTNVNVGTIHYGWSPVRTMGSLSVGFGSYNLNRQQIYQGMVWERPDGSAWGADVEYARSASDGSVPYGDHHFERVGGRLQYRTTSSQTDLFAGYQAKFFGWPNLYTPYGVNETENLQSTLIMLTHRVERNDGSYWSAGAYHRRNKDDYEYNRLVPGQFNPYQHTTWLTGMAVEGKEVMEEWAVRYRAETFGDKLQSTALTAGRYHTRQISKLTLAGERDWTAAGTGGWHALAGLTYDDSNRDGGSLSPVAQINREFEAGNPTRTVGLGYAEATQVTSYTALNSSSTAGLFRGNANLGREFSRNLELTLTGTYGGWQTTAALFQRWDDHLVDWTFKTGLTARTANPVDTVTRGFELVGQQDYNWGTLTLGYTVLGKNADYGSTTVDASFYALNYARQRLTAALTVQLGPAWELRIDNEARIQAKNGLRTMGGDEAILTSVGVVWRPASTGRLEWALQVDNLWDSDYQEVPAVPASRRQWALSAAYRW